MSIGHRGGGSLNLRRNKNNRFDDDDSDPTFEFEDPDEQEEKEKEEENQVEEEEPEGQNGQSGQIGEKKTKGKGKNRRRRKGPCEPLSNEPYVRVLVVKAGKDPNVTFSSGTAVKVSCASGYGLNIPENKTAKCVRGRWKPVKPECTIRECTVCFWG